jgi:hypothetical protein
MLCLYLFFSLLFSEYSFSLSSRAGILSSTSVYWLSFLQFFYLSSWAFHFQNFNLIFSEFLSSHWSLLVCPAFSSLFHLLFICIFFELIQAFICVLFEFIEHSYNHSFESFGISLTSLIQKYYCGIVAFGRVTLPCFYIFIVFLC